MRVEGQRHDMRRVCRNGGEKPAQAGWCDNSQSGLQDGGSASPIRLEEDHPRQNCGCVQPGEFGFSRRAIEAWRKVARSCAERWGEETCMSDCCSVNVKTGTAPAVMACPVNG